MRIISNEYGAAMRWLIIGLAIPYFVAAYFIPEKAVQPIGEVLVVNEAVPSANAIVVLLGGEGPGRVLKAYELYQQQVAPKIVYAAGYDNSAQYKEAYPALKWPLQYIRYHVALRSLGLPPEALEIVESPGAFDTSHELGAIAEHARKEGWTNIALVTSSSHTRRTKLVWNRLAPDINGHVVSAPEPGFDAWWQHGETRRSVAYEYLSLVKEFWHQVLSFLNVERPAVDQP